MGDEDEFYYDSSGGGSWWDDLTSGIGELGDSVWDYVTDVDEGLVGDAIGLVTKPDGSIDWGTIATIGGGVAGAMGLFSPDQQKSGYQGGIPSYTATREQVPTMIPAAAAEAKEYMQRTGYKPMEQQLAGLREEFADKIDTPIAQPYQYDPDRRPGSSGRRYFTDVQYTAPDQAESARTRAQERALGLAALNAANPARQTRPAPPAAREPVTQTPAEDASKVIDRLPVPNYAMGGIARLQGGGTPAQAPVGPMSRQDLINLYETNPREAFRMVMSGEVGGKPQSMSYARTYLEQLKKAQAAGQLPSQQPAPQMQTPPTGSGMARGGIASVQPKGYYLGGITDGMADKVPATIDNRQPAALSDGEFVIPADVVSHLGNGNSNAGAQQLYGMMDKVRQERTGTKQQGKQINPNKFMPA